MLRSCRRTQPSALVFIFKCHIAIEAEAWFKVDFFHTCCRFWVTLHMFNMKKEGNGLMSRRQHPIPTLKRPKTKHLEVAIRSSTQ